MKTQTSLSLRWGSWFLVGLLLTRCGSFPPNRTVAESSKGEALPRGVRLLDDQAETDKSRFFVLFEGLAGVMLRSRPPFGKSVAFLVGVSEYENLPDLPLVRNDLRDMRSYLEGEGGFDQVYLFMDEEVSAELLERYMMHRFPNELSHRDRLLFYFAGHGTNAKGTTGYLQFAGAQHGDLARHVLPVERVREWSAVSSAAHLLIVLDTCSSGLGLDSRSGPVSRSGSQEEDVERLLQTISGSGSRVVLTAGTAEQPTYEERGNGIFTRAFLDVLGQGQVQPEAPAFVTLEQVVAELELNVARYAAINRVALKPGFYRLSNQPEFRGTFVFLNPAVRHRPVDEKHLRLLGAIPNPVAPDLPPIPAGNRPRKPTSRGEWVSKVLQEFSERDSDLLLEEHARNHPVARKAEKLPTGEEILGFLYIKRSGNFLIFGAKGIYSHHSRLPAVSVLYSDFARLKITVSKLHVIDFGGSGKFSTVGSDVATDTLVSILRSLQQRFNSQPTPSTGGHP